MKYERLTAIQLLAEKDFEKISYESRKEILQQFSWGDWTGNIHYDALPINIRKELENENNEEIDYNSVRYNQAVLVNLSNEYEFYSNSYIQCTLNKNAIDCDGVTGDMLKQPFACPCCGYRTLSELGDFDICSICWWEDTGADTIAKEFRKSQSNKLLYVSETGFSSQLKDIFKLGLGSNKVDLIVARINFIEHGIADPQRLDLIEIQKSPNMFEKERTFIWDKSIMTLSEPDKNWNVIVSSEHLNSYD